VRVLSLELSSFRNYAAVTVRPPGGVCVFVGANAQGKSNLLEALSLLATGKSFRAARESDLIRDGAPLARVAARVQTRKGETNTAALITRVGEGARKRFLRNGRPVSYAHFLGGIAAVTFMPFDLQLVGGPPALRRRFLNLALSQADRAYYRDHAAYTRLVMEKNALLRSPAGVDRKLLATYNQQLVEVGARLHCARAAYVGRLSGEAQNAHSGWASGTLQITYQPSPPQLACDRSPNAVLSLFSAGLEGATALELARKTSLVGPHRDDMQFALDGRSLARFGSQGQQRTAVLALKAAEYSLLAAINQEPPLLLLDDVLSELDERRRRAFLRSMEDCEQAFVTATDLHEFGASRFAAYQILDGRIEGSAAASAS
jgi:DNA replication and repair protein RecF